MLYYFRLPVITNHISKKDLESMCRSSWHYNYLDYINMHTNLSNHWIDDVVSIENLNLKNYAYVLLSRNKIKRTTLEQHANLFLKIPLNLLKHISKKTNSKIDGIDTFFSIVDVITSDEFITAFKIPNSKDVYTMQTSIFALLFDYIDSHNIYQLKESDFNNARIFILTIAKAHLPQWLSLNVTNIGSSLILRISNIMQGLFPCTYDEYDKVKIKGRWYNYRDKKHQHVFININNEIYHISYKTPNVLCISDTTLCDRLNAYITEPKKLPGVKLEKTDGGFFDDTMMETEIK